MFLFLGSHSFEIIKKSSTKILQDEYQTFQCNGE